MQWNVLWQFLQSRGGKVEFVPSLRYGMALLTLAAVYFVTGRLGLSLGAVSGFATLVWLPSGLSVAALFLWGFRLWPAITVGAFLVNFSSGAPWPVAVGIGIGNTLEDVVCTALLKREKVCQELDLLHDVLVLVLRATPIGTIISATLGVGSLLLGGVISRPSVFETWRAWWLGGMISLLLFTPVLLVWSQWPFVRPSRERLIELCFLYISVMMVGLLIFLELLHPEYRDFLVHYLVFPPLIWAALRFGQHAVTASLAVFSGFVIVGSILGTFAYSPMSLSMRLLSVQTFMGVTAATILILAAVMAERRALEQRKDMFISMASHELRTPLTGLKGYTQLLRRQLTVTQESRAIRAVARIEMEIERLTRLIEDLLNLSKIQTGKLTFNDESVDVDALWREVVEQFQQTSTRHKISVEGSTPGIMVCDRERLSQVLNNLLTNAIKYSPEAEQVIVRLTLTTEGLTVSVQDFGIGIPKTEQEKVFQQFYRVASKRRQSAPGLGIGLSIAREIVGHYGGRIWVESVEGQGSTFSFSLPRQGSLQRPLGAIPGEAV